MCVPVLPLFLGNPFHLATSPYLAVISRMKPTHSAPFGLGIYDPNPVWSKDVYM